VAWQFQPALGVQQLGIMASRQAQKH